MKCAACGYEDKSYLSWIYHVIPDSFGRDVSLYACPKCGTVKVEVEDE